MTTVPVTLSHRFAEVDCSGKLYEDLRHFWSFYPPGYHRSPRFQQWLRARARAIRRNEPLEDLPGWDGRILLYKRGRLSAGLFRATYRLCEEELGIQFDIQRVQPKSLTTLHIQTVEVPDNKYSYQELCVQRMQKAVKRGGGVVLSATGTGKTALFAKFAKSIPNATFLFVVDTLDLFYQNKKEIESWLGEEVGLVGDSLFEPRRVTVGTIQTLHKHADTKLFAKWFKAIQILVVDELHDQMAKRNFALLESIKPLAIFGLTATLQLKKKEIRYRVYSFAGPVIFEFPLMEGVAREVLSEGIAVQLQFPALSSTDNYRDEYLRQVSENRTKQFACSLLTKYLIDRGRYVILLVNRIQHLKDLSGLFEGVPHRVAYGAIDKLRRKEAIQDLEAGEVRLLITNQIFQKGINIKRADVGIDMAEGYKKNNTAQKYGRLVRLHPDKNGLLYVDLSTQRSESDLAVRFAKNGVSRTKALKELGVRVIKQKVSSGEEAINVIGKLLDKREKTTRPGNNRSGGGQAKADKARIYRSGSQ